MKSQFYIQSQQLILVFIFFCFYSLFLLKHDKDMSNQQDRFEGKINGNWRYQKVIDTVDMKFYWYFASLPVSSYINKKTTADYSWTTHWQ